jgi:hypothetical protein
LMFCTEPRIWILLRGGGSAILSSREPRLLEPHSRLSEDYSGTAGVLDGELDFASFTGNTTCGALAHLSLPRHLPSRPFHPTPQYRRYKDHREPQRGTAQGRRRWRNRCSHSPMARERWSPCSVFTSLISNESR